MPKSQPGASNPAWRGGRYVNRNGYVMIYSPDHPRVIADCYVQEHTLVAEKALGKYLPPEAVVHHIDDGKQNNRPDNLVICENTTYHRLLHARRNAYRATGNVHARKCGYCHGWTLPDEPGVIPMGPDRIHRACRVSYSKARYDPAERRRKYLETGQ